MRQSKNGIFIQQTLDNFALEWESGHFDYLDIREFIYDALIGQAELLSKPSQQARWQQKQRELGLCIGCGKNPVTTTVRCESCISKNNLRRRKKK